MLYKELRLIFGKIEHTLIKAPRCKRHRHWLLLQQVAKVCHIALWTPQAAAPLSGKFTKVVSILSYRICSNVPLQQLCTHLLSSIRTTMVHTLQLKNNRLIWETLNLTAFKSGWWFLQKRRRDIARQRLSKDVCMSVTWSDFLILSGSKILDFDC